MSRLQIEILQLVFSFPRVSGDEPYPEGALVGAWTFSPRERG